MIGKGKLIYVTLFSFCLLFLFMGYATLTDELNIEGTATGTPQENVFITDVVTGNGDKVTLKGFYGTLSCSILNISQWHNSKSQFSKSISTKEQCVMVHL